MWLLMFFFILMLLNIVKAHNHRSIIFVFLTLSLKRHDIIIFFNVISSITLYFKIAVVLVFIELIDLFSFISFLIKWFDCFMNYVCIHSFESSLLFFWNLRCQGVLLESEFLMRHYILSDLILFSVGCNVFFIFPIFKMCRFIIEFLF